MCQLLSERLKLDYELLYIILKLQRIQFIVRIGLLFAKVSIFDEEPVWTRLI